MRNMETLLSRHPFLEGFTRDRISTLAPLASEQRHHLNELILRRGGEANACYLLYDGRVAVELNDPRAGHLVVQTLERTALGWSWLVPPYEWEFDVRALGPVRVIALDAEGLRRICEEDSEWGYLITKRMVSVLGQRLTAAMRQIAMQRPGAGQQRDITHS